MSIQQLPRGVIKQISSAQVINSISSAVKELFENALDAGATIIDVKLERSGLDKIEIRDNGAGIHVTDIKSVCLPHCTSKIRNFDDLERLQSYGFRGEALHSLCAVAQLSITTKTEHDEVASTYIFDNNGTVRDVKSSHQMNGTVVLATNLFKNVPVRKQFYENTRKSAEELKKIEKVIKQLSIIHPRLRVTLAHNRCLIWHKTSVCNLRQSLMQVYPSAVLKNLKDAHYSFDYMSIEMLIANRDCNLPVLLQPSNETVLLYINQRPVRDKKIEKVVFEEMNHLFASALPVNKFPLTLLSLRVSPEQLDVNLEPNKTKVFIKDHEEILKNVREAIMRHFYRSPDTNDKETVLLDVEDLQNPAKKQKLQNNSNFTASDDLDVSEMRNIIIEKTNVNHEAASKKLSNVKIMALNQPTTSLHDSKNGKSSDLNLKLNTDSFLPMKNDVLDSTFDVEKVDSFLVENKDSIILNDLSCTPRISLSVEKPSLVVRDDLVKEKEQVTADGSSFSNENPLKRSLVEEGESSIVALNLKNNADTESSRLDYDNHSPPIFSNENRSKETNISKLGYDSVTSSQWSRGHVILADETVESGVILFNGAGSFDYAANEEVEFQNETIQETCVSHDDTKYEDTNRHSSSQIEHENASGFTNFAHQVRSEIINKKPNLSFGVVVQELASRRSERLNEGKKVYPDNCSKKKQKSISDLRVNETFKRKTLALKISTHKILEELNIPVRLCQHSKKNKINPIGPLEVATKWLYEFNGYVSVVDVGHLQENVLLHRYMCNSSVPVKQLDEPIEISPRIVSEDLWQFLLKLERINDLDDGSISIVSDSRIVKNGFKIIIRENYNSFQVLIVEIAGKDGFDVMENFVETLKLVRQFEELEQCRSETTKTILLDKVLEVQKQKLVPKEATEIRMLLQYWVQCMQQKKICAHDKPISINLHKL